MDKQRYLCPERVRAQLCQRAWYREAECAQYRCRGQVCGDRDDLVGAICEVTRLYPQLPDALLPLLESYIGIYRAGEDRLRAYLPNDPRRLLPPAAPGEDAFTRELVEALLRNPPCWDRGHGDALGLALLLVSVLPGGLRWSSYQKTRNEAGGADPAVARLHRMVPPTELWSAAHMLAHDPAIPYVRWVPSLKPAGTYGARREWDDGACVMDPDVARLFQRYIILQILGGAADGAERADGADEDGWPAYTCRTSLLGMLGMSALLAG